MALNSTLSTKGKRGTTKKSTFASRATLGGGDTGSASASPGQIRDWAERLAEDANVFDEVEATSDSKLNWRNVYKTFVEQVIGMTWDEALSDPNIGDRPIGLNGYTLKQLDTYAKGVQEVAAKKGSIASSNAAKRLDLAKVVARRQRARKKHLRPI